MPTVSRGVWAAVIGGLLLRLLFGLGYWRGKPLTHDEQEYLLLGRRIATGHGFTYATGGETRDGGQEHFGRAPGYPVLLAVLMAPGSATEAAWADAPARVKIAQSVIGAIGIWLIAVIAARASGRRAGTAAAAIAAVYPPLVWMCAYVLSEALYSTLALAAVLALALAVERSARDTPRPRFGRLQTFAAGMLTGAGALTRPEMVVFAAAAGIWLAAQRRLAAALLFALGTGLVIAPWTVVNSLEHGRLVLIASEGGVTFWTGNHPLSPGEGDLAANPGIKRANLELRRRYPGLSPEELEPIYYSEALHYISRHPLWWAGLVLRKLFHVIVPVGASYRLHSALYITASLVSYGLLLPCGVAGFVRLRRMPSRPVTLWLLCGSAILVSLIFLPQERFRLPVIDPTLIVCAAAWFASRNAGRPMSSPTVPVV